MDDLNPAYAWIALGLAMAVAEMAIPGVFLIWMAGAALITGAAVWLMPGLALPVQVVLFAVLSIVAVFAGRRYLAANPVLAADPKMNDRGARLVGEIVQVTQAIESGSGRVRQGDGEWIARGPDAAAGTRMRVAGHDGAVLLVEHIQ